ncbi:hypothetical protein VTH82DRAFT_6400 [Thermothelomyces myriococcoides]
MIFIQQRVASLAAAALVGSVGFYPRTAHAEAPSERRFSRKPIYDDDFDIPPVAKPAPPPAATKPSFPAPSDQAVESPAPPAPSSTWDQEAEVPEPDITTVVRTRAPTPTDRLAGQIRRARLFLYAQACVAEDAVNGAMGRAFALERAFTDTLASLAPPRESGERLMPGLIYVLVAGMAGSIVARNRNVLLRGLTPLAFGLGAAWTVIPITMGNVSGLVWEYEKRVPAVADAHIRVREGIENGVYMARFHAELAQTKVEEGVRSVREALEDWVRKGK